MWSLLVKYLLQDYSHFKRYILIYLNYMLFIYNKFSIYALHTILIKILKKPHWLPIQQRINFKIILLTFKVLDALTATYISELISIKIVSRELRNNKGLLLMEHTPNLAVCSRLILLLMKEFLRFCSKTMEQAAICNQKH